jgi:hypothetical protein
LYPSSLERRTQLCQSPSQQRQAALERERKTMRSAYEAFQADLYAKNPDLRLHRGETAPFMSADAAALIPDT